MADQIVVLHEGRVVERGTHMELLALKGRYTSLWEKQIRDDTANTARRNCAASDTS